MTEHRNIEDPLNEDELAAYFGAYLDAFPPLAPPSSCPIGWQPNALDPVFYGVRDYSTADGAPANLRVFFPSLDGDVFSAQILKDCGRYPLILFVHGDCALNNPDREEHYKLWHSGQAQLAESGYVVVVPNFGLVRATDPDQKTRNRLDQTRTWMREQWEHRDVLMPEPKTGIYGHSFGALNAAAYANTRTVAAFAGLSGTWQDWSPPPPPPFEGLTVPMLFISGGGQDKFVEISPAQWNALPRPKHKVVFTQGLHWDYLPAGTTPCDQARGPCRFLSAAASDFVITFFSKYLPPELVPNLPDLIPDSLIPPPLDLSTFEKAFYGGGHLTGVSALSGNDECAYSVDWATPNSRRVPFVRFLPQANADHVVRKADLLPQYSGPSGQGSGPVWVFSQSPQPGARVTVGASVSMQLRRGPIP